MARRRFYLDANTVIALFEPASPESRARALSVLGDALLVTSEITLSEVLVGPVKSGDDGLAGLYLNLFEGDWATVLPADRATLIEAARLRGTSPMRLPDAIHVATAVRGGCEAVVSSDSRLRLPAPLVRLDPGMGGLT